MNFLEKIIDEVKNNGERPVLKKKIEEVDPVFRFAYEFAGKKAKNKSVLDYGCGGGYGSEFLSRFTRKKVVGFDIDQEVLKVNKRFFSNPKNLDFIGNNSKLKKYNLVVSFQVVEHLDAKSRADYLKKIKDDHLKKGGLFLLSTVNKYITSYKLKKPIMSFHECEFCPADLTRELKKYFRSVKVYGQTTKEMKKKVLAGECRYNKGYDQGVKSKILRFISQIEAVRVISRRIPLFIKSFIWGYESDLKKEYVLVKDKKLVNNAYVLICECR